MITRALSNTVSTISVWISVSTVASSCISPATSDHTVSGISDSIASICILVFFSPPSRIKYPPTAVTSILCKSGAIGLPRASRMRRVTSVSDPARRADDIGENDARAIGHACTAIVSVECRHLLSRNSRRMTHGVLVYMAGRVY